MHDAAVGSGHPDATEARPTDADGRCDLLGRALCGVGPARLVTPQPAAVGERELASTRRVLTYRSAAAGAASLTAGASSADPWPSDIVVPEIGV